jgi:ABC-2 type transport system ATP-binding protein
MGRTYTPFQVDNGVQMIEAKDITKDYGSVRALKNVSFSIPDQQVVGLLGHNGAGKTTLMKILTGFLQPSKGTARIGGIDVVDDPLSVQAMIGYLPENAPLYPDLLVQEYLGMIADLREIDPEERDGLISEAVRRTGLEDYLVRPIGELSKGYRQRVGLAQAILHRPRVLILDEPTSGLDPSQIVEIRGLIKELARSATVMVSTHILSEVELTCERVMIIVDGEVTTDAQLEELKKGNAAIVAVDSEATGVESALKAIDGVESVTREGPQDGFTRFRVESSAGAELCPSIHDVVREMNWRIAELRPDVLTLESIFRDVAERPAPQASGGAA